MWGQTSEELRASLRGLGEYEGRRKEAGAVWLIEEMKKAITGIDGKYNIRVTLHDAKVAM